MRARNDVKGSIDQWRISTTAEINRRPGRHVADSALLISASLGMSWPSKRLITHYLRTVWYGNRPRNAFAAARLAGASARDHRRARCLPTFPVERNPGAGIENVVEASREPHGRQAAMRRERASRRRRCRATAPRVAPRLC